MRSVRGLGGLRKAQSPFKNQQKSRKKIATLCGIIKTETKPKEGVQTDERRNREKSNRF
jgi:hypothetical protein